VTNPDRDPDIEERERDIAPVSEDGPQVKSRIARLRWYRNRLAAMSFPEILHRFDEQAKRTTSRRRAMKFDGWAREDRLPGMPGLAEGVRALAAYPAVIAEWRKLKGNVRAGRYKFLNVEWPVQGRLPDWHLDPVTNKRWPADVYCFDIHYRHADAIGDVKYVWELGRLQYLQPLAALAFHDNDEDLARRVANHLESWIDANPPFKGVNWSSGIELAMRVISILVVNTLIGDKAYTPALRAKVLQTLAAHGYWINRFPSRFSSANNHLIAEGAGLFLLGTLASNLKGAARWAAYGRKTLEQEALLQFHPDGVGAEQSPTYAAFSLECLAICGLVGQRQGAPFSDDFTKRLVAAAKFLRHLTDAGGHQPSIGDDDGGRVVVSDFSEPRYVSSILGCLAGLTGNADLAPPQVEPQFRHALLGVPKPAPHAQSAVLRYDVGGYTVARSHDKGTETLAVFDHGPLGYLSIAAHGHADALSLWLHLGGRPVLVDAGTYLYHAGAVWRDFFRGTIAHNTLTVRGLNSSSIAGPFNWSAKANCKVVGYDPNPDHWAVEAEHDGFVEATGYRHRRRVARTAPGTIEITDQLVGNGGVERVEIGFLFAPDLSLSASGGGWVIAAAGRPILRLRHEGGLKGWVERGMESPKRGWYSPAFGAKLAAPRLVFTGKLWSGASARFTLTLP